MRHLSVVVVLIVNKNDLHSLRFLYFYSQGYSVGCFFACRECLTSKHKAHVFLLIPIYLGSCSRIGREHWRKKCHSSLLKFIYLFLISFIYLFLNNFTIRVTHISQSRTPIFLAASVSSSPQSFPLCLCRSFYCVTHWDSPGHKYDFGTGDWSLEVSTAAVQLKRLVGPVLVSVSWCMHFQKRVPTSRI